MLIELSSSAYFLFENLKNKKKKLRKIGEGFEFNDKIVGFEQKFLLRNIQELIDKEAISFKGKSEFSIFGKEGDLIITRKQVIKKEEA